MRNHMGSKRPTGFSLIELLVAVAILAIIMAIAVPSYQQYIIKSHRIDAVQSLTDLSNRLERYYTENNTYASATIGAAAATDVLPAAGSSGGYYDLSIVSAGTTAHAYTIQATAKGAQSSDTVCSNFTLTDTGILGVSGSGSVIDCW